MLNELHWYGYSLSWIVYELILTYPVQWKVIERHEKQKSSRFLIKKLPGNEFLIWLVHVKRHLTHYNYFMIRNK